MRANPLDPSLVQASAPPGGSLVSGQPRPARSSTELRTWLQLNASVVEKQAVSLEGMSSHSPAGRRLCDTGALPLSHKRRKSPGSGVRTVLGTESDMTQDGATFPRVKTVQDAIQKSVAMLPLGTADGGEVLGMRKGQLGPHRGRELLAPFWKEPGCVFKVRPSSSHLPSAEAPSPGSGQKWVQMPRECQPSKVCFPLKIDIFGTFGPIIKNFKEKQSSGKDQ